MMGQSPGCYITSFMEISLLVRGKMILKGFYHICAWWPSWTCDQHHCYMPSFMEIVVLVGKKIFEGLLPYIGVAAILVM